MPELNRPPCGYFAITGKSPTTTRRTMRTAPPRIHALPGMAYDVTVCMLRALYSGLTGNWASGGNMQGPS